MVRKLKNKTRNKNQLLKKNIGKPKVSTSNVKLHERRSSKKISKRNRKVLRKLQKKMLSQSQSEATVQTNSNTSTEPASTIETPTVVSTSGAEANSEEVETVDADESEEHNIFKEDKKRDVKRGRKELLSLQKCIFTQSVSEANGRKNSNTPITLFSPKGRVAKFPKFEKHSETVDEDEKYVPDGQDSVFERSDDDNTLEVDRIGGQDDEEEDQNGGQDDEEEDQNGGQDDEEVDRIGGQDDEEEDQNGGQDDEEEDQNDDQEDSDASTVQLHKSIFNSSDDEDDTTSQTINHLSSSSNASTDQSNFNTSAIQYMKEVRVVLVDCCKYPELAGLTGKMKPTNNGLTKNVDNINGVNSPSEFDEDVDKNSKSDPGFMTTVKIESKFNKNSRQLRTRKNPLIRCEHCDAYLCSQLDLEIHISVHHARIKEGLVFTTYNAPNLQSRRSRSQDENRTLAKSKSSSQAKHAKSGQRLLTDDDDFTPEYLEITPKRPKLRRKSLTNSSSPFSAPNLLTTDSKCYICGNVLASARGLRSHLSQVHMHECPIAVCLDTFGSMDKLEKHLQWVHPELCVKTKNA